MPFRSSSHELPPEATQCPEVEWHLRPLQHDLEKTPLHDVPTSAHPKSLNIKSININSLQAGSNS